jgi:hypothetical protein
MSMLQLGFFKRKQKFKRSFIKRDRSLDNEAGHYFTSASFGLMALGKIWVTLSSVQIVVVPTITPEGFFLIFANVFLALGYFYNFFYRSVQLEITLTEAFLTVTGLTASIVLALYLASAMLLVSLTLPVLLVNCSVIATAINSFFLIKNVIIPPLKRMMECAFAYFGWTFQVEYRPATQLIKERHRAIIDLLLRPEGLNDGNNDKFESYNKILTKLDSYNNKYNEEVFGSFFRQKEITAIEKSIRELTTEGKDASALSILYRKLSFKLSKYKTLTTALNELTASYGSKNMDSYNGLCARFFDNHSNVRTMVSMEQSWNVTRPLLFNELIRQKRKFDRLKECIPRGCKGSELECNP